MPLPIEDEEWLIMLVFHQYRVYRVISTNDSSILSYYIHTWPFDALFKASSLSYGQLPTSIALSMLHIC